MMTPWGTAHSIERLEDGVIRVTTATHGAIRLSEAHHPPMGPMRPEGNRVPEHEEREGAPVADEPDPQGDPAGAAPGHGLCLRQPPYPRAVHGHYGVVSAGTGSSQDRRRRGDRAHAAPYGVEPDDRGWLRRLHRHGNQRPLVDADARALHASDDGSEDRGPGGRIRGHTVVTMARSGACARVASSRQSACKCEKDTS